MARPENMSSPADKRFFYPTICNKKPGSSSGTRVGRGDRYLVPVSLGYFFRVGWKVESRRQKAGSGTQTEEKKVHIQIKRYVDRGRGPGFVAYFPETHIFMSYPNRGTGTQPCLEPGFGAGLCPRIILAPRYVPLVGQGTCPRVPLRKQSCDRG